MENNDGTRRLLKDYAPSFWNATSSFQRLAILTNNFEVKPVHIKMLQRSVQYSGLPNEDPNAHIKAFLEFCDMIGDHGVTEDVIRLKLFPFSLRDTAKDWFSSFPAGLITTWDDLAQKFLGKFFPFARSAKLCNDIFSFEQMNDELLYEAWERFKELLRICPNHGLPTWLQVQTFYDGCSMNLRCVIDTAAGGDLHSKTPEEAFNFLEEMAVDNYQWSIERLPMHQASGVHEVDTLADLHAKLEVFLKNRECEFCGRAHESTECQVGNPYAHYNDYANFVGIHSRSQNDYYSNMYNPGWHNHQTFSWSNPSEMRPQPTFWQIEEVKPNLEDMISELSNSTQNISERTEASFQRNEASFQRLEVQMSQLISMISENQEGSWPSNVEKSPIDTVEAITLTCGMQLGEDNADTSIFKKTNKDVSIQLEETPRNNLALVNHESFMPPTPSTQRFQQRVKDKQFLEFLDISLKLHINIPFADTPVQISSCAKLLNERLKNKRKLEVYETVVLIEECTTIKRHKLSPKLLEFHPP